MNNSKTKWFVIVIIAAIVIILINASSLINNDSNSKTIEIGAIYALTGPAAKFGEISAKGARDAVKYFKQKENVDVKLYLEDSANDPKQGVSVAQKLFNVDGVKFAVVGTSGITNAVSPVAEQYKAVLITDAAGYGLTKGKDYLFQNFLPSLNDAAKQINANAKWKKVAIIYINDEFGNIWQKKTADSLIDKQALVIPFAKDSSDFKTDALKIKSFGPDVMFVVGYGPALNQVYADLSVQGVKTPIISYLSCTLPGVLTDKRFSLEGNYSYEYPTALDPTISKWIKDNGGEFNTFYTLAFENTLIALTAAKNSQNDSEAAKNYLTSTTISALYGNVSFGSEHVSERDLNVTTISDGKCLVK